MKTSLISSVSSFVELRRLSAIFAGPRGPWFGSKQRHPPGGDLFQQRLNGRLNCPDGRHNHRPLQVLPKLAGADSPRPAGHRLRHVHPGTDTDQRPLPCERTGTIGGGEGASHDEVIVPVDENAQAHGVSLAASAPVDTGPRGFLSTMPSRVSAGKWRNASGAIRPARCRCFRRSRLAHPPAPSGPL